VAPSVTARAHTAFLSLAQSQTDTGLLLMGNRLTGVSLIDMGDFPLALSHLERAVALYVPEEHRSLATWFGGDIGVVALAQWARTLWHRGHPDQASKTADKALRHARQREPRCDGRKLCGVSLWRGTLWRGPQGPRETSLEEAGRKY